MGESASHRTRKRTVAAPEPSRTSTILSASYTPSWPNRGTLLLEVAALLLEVAARCCPPEHVLVCTANAPGLPKQRLQLEHFRVGSLKEGLNDGDGMTIPVHFSFCQAHSSARQSRCEALYATSHTPARAARTFAAAATRESISSVSA